MVSKTKGTEGASQLRRALAPAMNQARLAEKLGVSQQAVSNWLHGTSKPTLKTMAALEDLLGIPIRSWGEPESTAKSARQ